MTQWCNWKENAFIHSPKCLIAILNWKRNAFYNIFDFIHSKCVTVSKTVIIIHSWFYKVSIYLSPESWIFPLQMIEVQLFQFCFFLEWDSFPFVTVGFLHGLENIVSSSSELIPWCLEKFPDQIEKYWGRMLVVPSWILCPTLGPKRQAMGTRRREERTIQP